MSVQEAIQILTEMLETAETASERKALQLAITALEESQGD